MNKYATLDEDVDVAGDESSIQKEGRGFEIAAGQVRVPKSTGVSVCSPSWRKVHVFRCRCLTINFKQV